MFVVVCRFSDSDENMRSDEAFLVTKTQRVHGKRLRRFSGNEAKTGGVSLPHVGGNARLLRKHDDGIAVVQNMTGKHQKFLALFRILSVDRNPAAFDKKPKEIPRCQRIFHHTPDIVSTAAVDHGKSQRDIVVSLVFHEQKDRTRFVHTIRAFIMNVIKKPHEIIAEQIQNRGIESALSRMVAVLLSPHEVMPGDLRRREQ